MHPVANQIPVPTDAIERELLAVASRRFTGRIKLSLRLKPEAALSVELMDPETIENQRPGERILRSPDVFDDLATTERGLLVTRFLRANSERFRLVVRPAFVVCDFKEGTLGSVQWITVG